MAAPRFPIADVGERRTRDLVAVLVVVVAGVVALALAVRGLLRPQGFGDDDVVGAAVLASFAVIYVLNRGRHHRLATLLFCLGPLWLNSVEGLLRPEGPVWFALIPLGAILAGGLLRPRDAIAVAVVGTMAAVAVVVARRDALPADRGVLIVFHVAVVSAVVVGFTYFRARVEAARRAELERLSAQLAATERLESIGRLAGGIAHDFNNLLAVMMLSSEAARAGDLSALDDVEAAGERAAALVRQLLAFSRRRTGALVSVPVDDALLALEPLLRRLLPLSVELEVRPGAGAAVELEDQQLEQLVLNLAANARDAMPEGGHLDISTTVEDVPAGAAAPRLPGRFVVVRVRDDGAGIDAAALPHVLEPFFTTKEVGDGTGLGLSTVYGIVRRSGGWLDVDSAPGRGTSITVALPVRAAASAPPTPPPRHHADDRQRERR